MNKTKKLDNVRPCLKAARACARDECRAVAMKRPILSMNCIDIVHKKWKIFVCSAINCTSKSLKSTFSFQKQ